MTNHPSLPDLLAQVKAHPNISNAGMILCHNGIVRASDRSGTHGVEWLRVSANTEKIQEICTWAQSLPGIVAVAIQAFEGELRVGDDLLFIVIAGDIREHVLDAMRQTLDRVKNEAVSKQEELKPSP